MHTLKICIVIALAGILFASVTARDRRKRPHQKKTQDLWYDDQCKNHFGDNPCDEKWSQFYQTREKHHKEGGPLFFLFGGETASETDLTSFIWEDWAKEVGAYMVFLEHRFYKQSFPADENTLKGMRLLSSEQALEDAARFIPWFKRQTPGIENAKVITFGSSYPGALSAWIRQKHPDIVHAALASSAPLEYKYDFPEYYGDNAKVITAIDKDCGQQLTQTFTCIKQLLDGNTCDDTSYTSRDQLPSVLSECSACDMDDDPINREIFIHNLAIPWSSNWPSQDNTAKCQSFKDQNSQNDDLIDAFAAYREAQNFTPCSCDDSRRKRDTQPMQIKTPALSHKAKPKRAASKPKRDENSWQWQTCNEFGNFQTSVPMFANSWTNQGDVNYCSYVNKVFKKAGFTPSQIQKNIENTNRRYKGKNNTGTCIIFINGSWDPWHSRGITKESETSEKNSVIMIKHGEHGDDLSKPEANDIPWNKEYVTAAQKNILKQLKKYIADDSC